MKGGDAKTPLILIGVDAVEGWPTIRSSLFSRSPRGYNSNNLKKISSREKLAIISLSNSSGAAKKKNTKNVCGYATFFLINSPQG